MNTHADKSQENKSQSVVNTASQKPGSGNAMYQFADNRPGVGFEQKLKEMSKHSPQAKQAAQLQAMADNFTSRQPQVVQRKGRTGALPEGLKSGIEHLSGYSMNDVSVHYNSEKPAQLQAHAYAQGAEIHLGPGQEKHLPHEAWHVVQQKQGRVKATMQMVRQSEGKGTVGVNDDMALEREADAMGNRALQMKTATGQSHEAPSNDTTSGQIGYFNARAQQSPKGVAQLRGFTKVNGADPNPQDQATGAFVVGSLAAWDNIFADNAIDQAGGIIATYQPGQQELDAEAVTKYEEVLEGDEFAVVRAEGSAGTTIKRYAKQAVQTEDVILSPEVFGQNMQTIYGIIETALFGNATGRTGDVAADWIDDIDLDIGEDQSIIDYAQAQDAIDWLPQAFMNHLGQKVDQYNGIIPPDVLDVVQGSNAFSTQVMANIAQTLGLIAHTRDEYVGADSALDTIEVLSHEFGHVKAALSVSPETIGAAKAGLGPNWLSVKTVINQLNATTKPAERTTHDRTRNTNLRFAWLKVVTQFYQSAQEVQEDHDLRDAIKILFNLLISFEEYFNIESVDNSIPQNSDTKKRVSHGTERATAASLGFDLNEESDRGLANLNPDWDASTMAKVVWISKLKTIITVFIEKYNHKFPE